jgi:hypothetical protein
MARVPSSEPKTRARAEGAQQLRRNKAFASELQRQILSVLFAIFVTAGAVYLFAATHRTIIAAQPVRASAPSGED